MKTKKVIIGLMIIAMLTGAMTMNAQALTSIGNGVLHILGIALSIFPGHQDAPINTETAVNTELLLPDVGPEGQLPGDSENLLVVAELTGPGITTPRMVAAKPGEQLLIPPLPEEGSYVLDNIRFMDGEKVIMPAGKDSLYHNLLNC